MNGRKRSGKGDTNTTADFAVGYLYRAMETEIDRIAMETGGEITIGDLARRLAGLLETKAVREELGNPERMPHAGLRRKTAKGSKLASGKAVGVRASRNGSLRMYARMEARLRSSKNPKLRAQAIKWFKKNRPNSVNAKAA